MSVIIVPTNYHFKRISCNLKLLSKFLKRCSYRLHSELRDFWNFFLLAVASHCFEHMLSFKI